MFNQRLKMHFNWPLFWVAFALCAIGLLNLHSATYNIATGGVSGMLISQLMWFGIGFVVSFIILFIDYRVFLTLAYPSYVLSIILLVLVALFGKEVAGNKNWLVVGPISFQPSEFAKMAFILTMAKYLSEKPPSFRSYGWLELIVPLILFIIPLGLILIGKDIGSSLFLIATFGSLILFSGVKKQIVIVCLVIGLAGSVVAYKKMMSGHQKARILAFLHPDEDPKGRGYHLLQSKIAVGSGQMFGKGYLKGMHNKLLYLPEKHTDFIFPVWAEEWGFVGSLVVLGFYIALLLMGLFQAMQAKESFGLFLALGVTSLFFWQIVINLGGVLGLIPLTGVTLPFLSYGGSSLVMMMVGTSFLLNISMRRFMF